MTARSRVEVEVSRPDSEPRTVAITAPADTRAGAVLDALGAHLGLLGAAGAVQARSLVCGRWIDREATLATVGLARGERLALTVGLAPGGRTGTLVRWPEALTAGPDGRVAVSRPARAVHAEPELSIVVPRKRTHRPPRRFPLGAILIPVAIGLILVLAVRRWEIALFALFTPVMVAWNYYEERRARSDELREHGRTYDEDVRLTFEEIDATTAAWAAWLQRQHPAPAEVVEAARTLGPRLWERHPGDPDFLHVRLGLATRRAPVTLRREGGSISAQQGEPDYESSARVGPVPATVGLASGTGLAVVGSADALDGVAAWIAAQVVTLHSPADVLLAGMLSDRETRDWWRWLPHVARGVIAAEPVVDAGGATELLDALADLAVRRRTARDGRRTAGSDPLVVVFVDDRVRPDPARLAELMDASDVRIVTVWLGTSTRAVPSGVSHVLSVSDGSAELLTLQGGERVTLTPEQVSRSDALDLSASLAPLRDAADAHQLSAVPERVALDELIPDLTAPAGLRRRWEAAPVTQLTAHLGLGADEPFELELGPLGSHALVGGTTGSGKSELLQTMVASLAACYPPTRVGFLLVDYKGGAAFKDAMHLPHTVGVVTDLDDHLTRRVMIALDAEIRRREHLLAAGGARDLTELRRTAPDDAPADLLIVVDEFATLAKELPAFVEGVVDIAARGRSLGLRLVLATQRPAGVINDRIRANVGVRIALRVNDEADSQDVIESREAAHIPRTLPGRAYARVDRALTEFQSAFVGGPRREHADLAVEVRDLWRSSPPSAGPVTARTVLEELVTATRNAARLGRWPRPHVPWLPALPPVVTLADLAGQVPPPADTAVVMGLADLPERQAQQVVAFDLEQHQNMLVFGTARSGKTTLLRTLAAGFVSRLGPDAITIYGLDFAGHGLHALEGAPQVGGVAGPDDLGRVARLLRRLATLVEERKRVLMSNNLVGFADLAASSSTPVPRVLVLLDGYAAATSALERVEGGRLLERLERLIPDGPSVGVHFVVTADRRAAVPSALTSVITSRLVLRMAEKDDYALVGVRPGLGPQPGMPPGRAYLQGTTEVQVAVQSGDDPADEAAALADLVAEARGRWPVGVRPLLRMPGQVDLARLPAAPSTFVLPFAVGDSEVLPVALDLSDGHALVAGPPRSGRSTTLASLALAARRAAEPAALALVCGRRTPVVEAGPFDVGPVDGQDAGALAAAVADIGRLLDEGRPVLCLVDDVDSLPDAASAVLEELCRRGRDERIRVVAAVDNRWALRAYGGLVAELRRSKRGVLMAPDLELDGDLVGVRLRPPLETTSLPGRGFLAQVGVNELVQVAIGSRPATIPSNSE